MAKKGRKPDTSRHRIIYTVSEVDNLITAVRVTTTKELIKAVLKRDMKKILEIRNFYSSPLAEAYGIENGEAVFDEIVQRVTENGSAITLTATSVEQIASHFFELKDPTENLATSVSV